MYELTTTSFGRPFLNSSPVRLMLAPRMAKLTTIWFVSHCSNEVAPAGDTVLGGQLTGAVELAGQ
jgi:hypothetical protein